MRLARQSRNAVQFPSGLPHPIDVPFDPIKPAPQAPANVMLAPGTPCACNNPKNFSDEWAEQTTVPSPG
jgi:hypothetical protein